MAEEVFVTGRSPFTGGPAQYESGANVGNHHCKTGPAPRQPIAGAPGIVSFPKHPATDRRHHHGQPEHQPACATPPNVVAQQQQVNAANQYGRDQGELHPRLSDNTGQP